MNRRALFGVIPFLGVLRSWGKPKPPPQLPEGHEIFQSFDARVWANAFVLHLARYPAIASDREAMTTWFTSSLQRGWVESQHQRFDEVNQAGAAHVRLLTEDAIGGAVARGWCSKANVHKEFDGDLAEAIVQEVMALPRMTCPEMMEQGLAELQRNAERAFLKSRIINARFQAYGDQMEAALV